MPSLNTPGEEGIVHDLLGDGHGDRDRPEAGRHLAAFLVRDRAAQERVTVHDDVHPRFGRLGLPPVNGRFGHCDRTRRRRAGPATRCDVPSWPVSPWPERTDAGRRRASPRRRGELERAGERPVGALPVAQVPLPGAAESGSPPDHGRPRPSPDHTDPASPLRSLVLRRSEQRLFCSRVGRGGVCDHRRLAFGELPVPQRVLDPRLGLHPPRGAQHVLGLRRRGAGAAGQVLLGRTGAPRTPPRAFGGPSASRTLSPAMAFSIANTSSSNRSAPDAVQLLDPQLSHRLGRRDPHDPEDLQPQRLPQSYSCSQTYAAGVTQRARGTCQRMVRHRLLRWLRWSGASPRVG